MEISPKGNATDGQRRCTPRKRSKNRMGKIETEVSTIRQWRGNIYRHLGGGGGGSCPLNLVLMTHPIQIIKRFFISNLKNKDTFERNI